MFKNWIITLALCFTLELCGACNPYATPTHLSGLVPFTIVNNSKTIATSNLYITITGTNPATDTGCIVSLANVSGNYIGTLIDSGTTAFSVELNSLQYSYPVSSLPLQNGLPVFYLPRISNATVYLSVGFPMGLGTAPASPFAIQPPQLFTTTDPNYYHLYDNSLFFSIGNELNVQSQYLNGFGLPVSAIVSMNGGTSVQYSGIATPRATLLDDFTTAVSNISNSNAKTEWEKLPISFTSASGTGPTQLRLASLFSAMNFASSPFDTSYLIDSMDTYGADWASTVFATTNVYFDVSALPPQGSDKYSTYLFTGLTAGNLVFTSQGSAGTNVEIPYPFTTSLPFLNGAATGPDSFDAAGDSLAAPLICGYLSAGFASGLFPVAGTSTSNPFGGNYLAYANVNGDLYKANPALTAGSGPWYDLFGGVLHSAANGTAYFNFQADVADVDLGFFSPIVVDNNSNAQPSVFVVLNDCTDTIIPNFADATMYDVLIAADTMNTTVLLNGSPAPDTQTPVSVPFTLEITYMSGTFTGKTYSCSVWVNNTDDYAIVFPQPPGTITPTFEMGGGFWNIGISDSP